MLDLAFRDLRQHRLRTTLTVLGIVIAIAAIVSLGSISSGLSLMVENGMKKLGSDLIIVTQRMDNNYQTGPPRFEGLDDSIADEIRQIQGVSDAVPVIRKISQYQAIGVDPEYANLFQLDDMKFEEGDWYDKGSYEVVMGKTIAEGFNLRVGDIITINQKDLEVVGILEEAGSGGGAANSYNLFVAMPYEVAQDVFDMKGQANTILVKPESVSDANSIKNEINNEYDDIQAMTTTDALKRAQQTIGQVSVVTIGVGVIASLVAAIGIVITMITSVHERRKQIGIMKAVGAESATILIQILQEGLIISIIGGFIGLAIGSLMVGVINSALLGGIEIASVTAGLSIGAFTYGIVLCLAASIYPAWKATKVNPVEAMREA